MNGNRKFLPFLVLVIAFSACEKTVDFDLDEVEPALVVDGTIETGLPPVIVLTKSLNYFSAISPDLINNAFVRNATVTVSGGGKTVQLIEKELSVGSGISFFYYTADTSSPDNDLRGVEGTRYDLKIVTGDGEFEASTLVPVVAKGIDSLWWEPAPDNPDSSKVVLMGQTTDPPGFGNYSRYFTRVNSGRFLPGLNSVFDDQVIDGKTYSVQIEQGVDRNDDIDFEEYPFFQKGDTVTVKLCTIDKATYEFWRTMEYSFASIGNPFSSPTRVLGNISGGALGYFGGYAPHFSTIVIPN
jgi:hypothetical protein